MYLNFTKRKETYKIYSDSNPVPADKLCEAGFFHEGIGDKVKCFWCDGALEMWSKGDEPWMEHAKWYPGCTYVQQTKGLDFIRKARATMTPDNVHTADTLTYNKGDVAFLVMPQRDFDEEYRLAIADYVPGYDWIPGRFGPPPGIPKARKDEFDAMNDREYLYAFLKLSQEEKESLMVSEAERRRTFTAHWPIGTIVKANDCAKEGFYYTGVADRVQCAFCGGIVRNWERGDVPKLQHKNFFNYCRMVQNKPCQNIPLNECGLPKELMMNQLSSNFRTDSRPATLGDLNINTVRPKDPSLSVFTKRKETYKRYSDSNPVPADKLCEAGFFYEGIGDKVKCFWCGGALEMWSKGDEPWMEHAKWYPGCTYVQQTKGLDFIRKARATMTPDNVHTADTLTYNKGDVAFLDVKIPEPEPELPVESKNGYKFCLSLGYRHEDIKEVYEANNNEEFDMEDQARLVGIVQELSEGNRESLEKFIEERSTQQKRETKSDGVEQMDTSTLPSRRINLPELITNPNEPSDKECKDILDAMKCKKCKTRLAGAVVLPCGCFCLCQECSRGNLPTKCPACSNIVKGACRTFLS